VKTHLFFVLITAVLLLPVRVNGLERFDIISTRQLVEMLQLRQAGAVDFVLVNSLDEVIFRDAHIPGSINLPLPRIDKLIGRLGTDRKTLIIPY
jgi:hypothetical protein